MENNHLHEVDQACDVSEVLPLYISDLIKLLAKQTPYVPTQTARRSDKGPDSYLTPVSHWCNPIAISHFARALHSQFRLALALGPKFLRENRERGKIAKRGEKGSIFHLTPSESLLPSGM